MDTSKLIEYINFVTWGMCLCIGSVLKSLFTKFPNRFIPLSMLIVGMLINIALYTYITPEILLGGMVSGLASTGAYEVFKNTIEQKEK